MSETSEMGVLQGIDRALTWALRGAAVLLVLGMLVIVCGAVLLRMLGTVVFGADELTRLLLSWTVGVGVALAAREGGHLAVEAVVDCLSGVGRRAMLVLACVLSVAFLALLTVAGAQFAVAGFADGAPTPALGISPGWVALAWPVSALFTLAYVIRDLWVHLTGRGPEPAEDTAVTEL